MLLLGHLNRTFDRDIRAGSLGQGHWGRGIGAGSREELLGEGRDRVFGGVWLLAGCMLRGF